MQNKGLKFAPVVELAKLNFTYITELKKPKLGLGLMIGPSIQINSCSPCINTIISELKVCFRLPKNCRSLKLKVRWYFHNSKNKFELQNSKENTLHNLILYPYFWYFGLPICTLQMFTGNYGDLAGKICNIYGIGL